MSLIQLTITCPQNAVHTFETLCEAMGALSTTISAADNEEIFEPELNTAPLWQHCVLHALFEKNANIDAITSLAHQTMTNITISELEEQDWQNAWKQEFHTMKFGERLTICPSHEIPDILDEFTIVLDPGLAFGTGKHPTTSLCLQWLDKNIRGSETVIDYGCGSGILAMAAAKLGAKKIYAIDIDEQALEATKENAKNNHIRTIETYFPNDMPNTCADVLIANILTNPLIELASTLRQLVKNNGKIALSGILESQKDRVIEAYQQYFHITDTLEHDGWILIAGNTQMNR